MPEGDTIYRAAHVMNRALASKTVTRFESPLVHLARVEIDSPVTGRTIESVEAAGKWNLMRFSGDLILATHMLMNGSWHLYRPGERWQKNRRDMRILIETPEFVAVGFNVPVAQFHTNRTLARQPRIANQGPDLLAPEFDTSDVAGRLRAQANRELGSVLLDQRVLAGAGNVFKSEVMFVAGINPFRAAASLSQAEAAQVALTARSLLKANAAGPTANRLSAYRGWRRTTGSMNPEKRLWVYGRKGEPCRKCGTAIACRKQGLEARVTFWCPRCQPEG